MPARLILSALRVPPESAPERRTIARAPFTIGRGSDNDWVLVDHERKLSKRHCVLARAGEGWEVTDESSNGTFLNGETAPLGARRARLATGDRLRLGPYEFTVSIQPEAPPPPPERQADMTQPPRPRAAAADPDTAGDPALLDAFLHGAGAEGLVVADPARTLERAGAMLRAAVAGLRTATAARAAVKDEFRIEQTVLRARANNPIRFAGSDAEAVAELLADPDPRTMPGLQAVREAARDLRLHELATLVAMQEAARALAGMLAPDRVAAAEGGLALPFSRKAANWDSYVAAHARIADALADRFDSVWGAAFADAYERSLAELRAAGEPARA